MRIENKTEIPTKLIAEITAEIAELEHVRVENVPVYVGYTKYARFSGTAHTNKNPRECHLHGIYVDAGYIRLKLCSITVTCLSDFLNSKTYSNAILDSSQHPVYLRNLIFLIAHEFSHIKDAQQLVDIKPEHRRMRHDNRPHEIEANRRAESCLVCLLERGELIERWQQMLRVAYYDSL